MHDLDHTRQRSNKALSRSNSPNRGAAAAAPYNKVYAHYYHNIPPSSSSTPRRSPPRQTKSQSATTTSAWQQLVVGASSAAGTTAAVVSEESMKCMKYCLNWLQYAMKHIEQQMNLLRSFLVSLATSNNLSSSLTVPNNNHHTPSVLTAVKKDIVDTLRKVVDIISKYAGSSLPYHAKVTVRGFILSLPGRWATLNDIQSTTTSPMTSPILSATHRDDIIREKDDDNDESSSSLPKNEETAIRLLNFGQESIDMLNSISTVFSDSVDRAELWIDKLRLRPVDHNNNNNNNNSMMDDDQHIKLPPIHSLDLNQFNDYHQHDDHQQHHHRSSQLSPAYS